MRLAPGGATGQKTGVMRFRVSSILLCLLSLGFLSVRLQAQVLTRYWDINGPTAGAGGITPSGTWDGSSNNWTATAAGTATATTWSSGAVAVFSAGTDATGAYTVTVSGTQTIDSLTGEEGTLTLTGGTLNFSLATSFNIASTVNIGSALTGSDGILYKIGTGTLNLTGLGSYVGGTNIVAGTLNLTGTVSHSASDMIVNGNAGPTPALNLTGSGDLITDRLRIGVTDNTFSGAVTVSGAGTTVTNTTYLYVGEAGSGTLSITNGGSVTGPNTSIGNNATGVGTVTVSGSGSTLVNTSTLYVGSAGDGALIVNNAGTVTNLTGVVGNNAGGAGTAQIDGAGSTWTNTGTLTVGNSSDGIVAVLNSGSISAASATFGAAAGVEGSVGVYAGGTFSTTGNLVIGHNGLGELSVAAGSVTTGGQAILANNTGSSGAVYLDNAGSLWTVGGDLYVGNAGSGFMRAIGSSVLNVGGPSGTGTIHLGHTGGTGSLHIGYDGEGYNLGAVINAAAITTGTGTGTLLFGTSAAQGTPYYFTKDATSGGTFVTVGGATQVQQINGYNVLGGASTYTGGTVISGGTLVAASAGALGTGTVQLNGGSLSVNSGVTLPNTLTATVGGGTIGGNGTYSAAFTAGANVHLSPGNSVGTVTFSGGLTLASSGTYDLDVQFATAAAGTGYDLISISNAPLDITATSGSPFTLRLISRNISGALGNVSDFSASSPYAWTIATSAAGITGFSSDKFVVTTANFSNSLGIGKFFVTQSGNNLVLNFTPVPEPSTYALMVAGIALAGLTYRRRKQSSRGN
jgi:T5SS/PEP-CTERM-associated repeat protein/autotransporter-associated beta strand protein